MKDQIKRPRPDVAARLECEVKKRWQPHIRVKARVKAVATGGSVIDARARVGGLTADRVGGQAGGRRLPRTAGDRAQALTRRWTPAAAGHLWQGRRFSVGRGSREVLDVDLVEPQVVGEVSVDVSLTPESRGGTDVRLQDRGRSVR